MVLGKRTSLAQKCGGLNGRACLLQFDKWRGAVAVQQDHWGVDSLYERLFSSTKTPADGHLPKEQLDFYREAPGLCPLLTIFDSSKI